MCRCFSGSGALNVGTAILPGISMAIIWAAPETWAAGADAIHAVKMVGDMHHIPFGMDSTSLSLGGETAAEIPFC